MHVYPLDKKLKDDRPFWALPKRPPTALVFDSTTSAHINLIASAACLRAKIFGIEIDETPREIKIKTKWAAVSEEFNVKEFIPNEEKAS